ncbi:MAG: hypothetical protein ACFCGT_27980 [Sandaracinaceae bacterium]
MLPRRAHRPRPAPPGRRRAVVLRAGALGLVSALLLVPAGLLDGSPTRAQAGAPSDALQGTFVYAGRPAAGERIIRDAIDAGLRGLEPELERLARARLAESTWLPRTIQIDASAERIRVRYEGEDSRTFDTEPGEPENMFSPSGVRAQLIQSVRPDGGIQQNLRALDGTQINMLTPTRSGGLALDVVISSRRVRREIRFQLLYRRSS